MLQQPFLQQFWSCCRIPLQLVIVARISGAYCRDHAIDALWAWAKRGLQQVPSTGCSELQHVAAKMYELQQHPEMELQQSCNGYSGLP